MILEKSNIIEGVDIGFNKLRDNFNFMSESNQNNFQINNLNIMNYIYDEDFVTLINSLSSSIKEFFKHSKGCFGLLKSSSDSMVDLILHSKSTISDLLVQLNSNFMMSSVSANPKFSQKITKDSGSLNKDRSIKDKICGLITKLESINEVRATIAKNIKSLEQNFAKFYGEAKVLFKKMKKTRNEKLEEFQNINNSPAPFKGGRSASLSNFTPNMNNNSRYASNSPSLRNFANINTNCSIRVKSSNPNINFSSNGYSSNNNEKSPNLNTLHTKKPFIPNNLDIIEREEKLANDKIEHYKNLNKDLMMQLTETKKSLVDVKFENLSLKEKLGKFNFNNDIINHQLNSSDDNNRENTRDKAYSMNIKNKDFSKTYHNAGTGKFYLNKSDKSDNSLENIPDSFNLYGNTFETGKNFLKSDIKKDLQGFQIPRQNSNISEFILNSYNNSRQASNEKMASIKNCSNNNIQLSEMVLNFVVLLGNLQDSISRKNPDVPELKKNFELKKRELCRLAENINKNHETTIDINTIQESRSIKHIKKQSVVSNNEDNTIENYLILDSRSGNHNKIHSSIYHQEDNTMESNTITKSRSGKNPLKQSTIHKRKSSMQNMSFNDSPQNKLSDMKNARSSAPMGENYFKTNIQISSEIHQSRIPRPNLSRPGNQLISEISDNNFQEKKVLYTSVESTNGEAYLKENEILHDEIVNLNQSIKDLKNEIENKINEINSLNNYLEQEKKKAISLEIKVKDEKSISALMEAKLKEEKKKNKDLDDEINKNREKINNILLDQQTVKILEEKIKELKYKNNNLIEKLNKNEDEMSNISENYQKKVFSLSGERENVKKQLESYVMNIDEKEKEITRIKEELANKMIIIKDNEFLQNQNSLLKNEIEKLKFFFENEKISFNSQFEEYETTLKRLKEDHSEEIQALKSDLGGSIQNLNSRIEEYKNLIKKLKEEHISKIEELKLELEGYTQNFNSKITEYKTSIKKLKEDHMEDVVSLKTDSESIIQNLNSQIDEYKIFIKKMKQDHMQDMEKLKNDSEGNKQNLNSQIEELKIYLKKLNQDHLQEIDKLNSEMESNRQIFNLQIDEHKIFIKKLKEDNLAEIEKLESNLDDNTKNLNQLIVSRDNEIKTLIIQIEEMNKNVKELNDNLIQRDEKIKTIEKTYSVKIEEITKISQKLILNEQIIKGDIEDKERIIEKKNEDIQSFLNSISVMKFELSNLSEIKETLNIENGNLKEKAAQLLSTLLEKDEMKNKIENLDSEIKKLVGEIKKNKEHLDKKISDNLILNEEKINLSKENDNMKIELSHLTQMNKLLEDENESYKKDMHNSATTNEARVKEEKNKNRELSEFIIQKDQEILKSIKENKKLLEKIDKFEEEIERYKSSISVLYVENDQIRNDLNKIIKTNEDEIKYLKVEKENIQSDIKEAIKLKDKEVDSLNLQVVDLKESLIYKEEANKIQTEEKQKLNVKFIELNNSNLKMSSEYEEIIKNKEKEINVLMSNKSKLADMIKERENEIFDMKKEKENIINSFNEDIDIKNKEIKNLVERREALEIYIEDKKKELSHDSEEKDIIITDLRSKILEIENVNQSIILEKEKLESDLYEIVLQKDSEILLLKDVIVKIKLEFEEKLCTKVNQIEKINLEKENNKFDLESVISNKNNELIASTEEKEKIKYELSKVIEENQLEIDNILNKKEKIISELVEKIKEKEMELIGEKEKEVEYVNNLNEKEKIISELDDIINNRNEEIKILSKEKEKIIHKMTDDINKKENDIKKLISDIYELEKNISDQNSNINYLSNDINEFKKTVENQEEEIGSLKNEKKLLMEELKEKLMSKEDQINLIKKHSEEIELTKQELIIIIKENKQIIESSSVKIEDLEKEKEKVKYDVNKLIESNNDELNRLKKEYEKSLNEENKRNRIIIEEMENLNLEIGNLYHQIETLKLEKEHVNNCLSDKEKSSKDAITNLNMKIKTLESQIKFLNNENSDKDESINNLIRNLENEKLICSKHLVKIANQEDMLASSEMYIKQVEKDMVLLNNQTCLLENDKKKLKSDIDLVKVNCEKDKKELDEKLREVNDLNELYNQKCLKLNSDTEKLKEDILNNEREIKNKLELIEMGKMENNKLNETIKSLNEEIELNKKDLTSLSSINDQKLQEEHLKNKRLNDKNIENEFLIENLKQKINELSSNTDYNDDKIIKLESEIKSLEQSLCDEKERLKIKELDICSLQIEKELINNEINVLIEKLKEENNAKLKESKNEVDKIKSENTHLEEMNNFLRNRVEESNRLLTEQLNRYKNDLSSNQMLTENKISELKEKNKELSWEKEKELLQLNQTLSDYKEKLESIKSHFSVFKLSQESISEEKKVLENALKDSEDKYEKLQIEYIATLKEGKDIKNKISQFKTDYNNLTEEKNLEIEGLRKNTYTLLEEKEKVAKYLNSLLSKLGDVEGDNKRLRFKKTYGDEKEDIYTQFEEITLIIDSIHKKILDLNKNQNDMDEEKKLIESKLNELNRNADMKLHEFEEENRKLKEVNEEYTKKIMQAVREKVPYIITDTNDLILSTDSYLKTIDLFRIYNEELDKINCFLEEKFIKATNKAKKYKELYISVSNLVNCPTNNVNLVHGKFKILTDKRINNLRWYLLTNKDENEITITFSNTFWVRDDEINIDKFNKFICENDKDKEIRDLLSIQDDLLTKLSKKEEDMSKLISQIDKYNRNMNSNQNASITSLNNTKKKETLELNYNLNNLNSIQNSTVETIPLDRYQKILSTLIEEQEKVRQVIMINEQLKNENENLKSIIEQNKSKFEKEACLSLIKDEKSNASKFLDDDLKDMLVGNGEENILPEKNDLSDISIKDTFQLTKTIEKVQGPILTIEDDKKSSFPSAKTRRNDTQGSIKDSYKEAINKLEESEKLFTDQMKNIKDELKETRSQRDNYKRKYEESLTLQDGKKIELLSMLKQAFEKLLNEIQLTAKIREYVIVIFKILDYNEEEINKILNKKDKKSFLGLFKPK